MNLFKLFYPKEWAWINNKIGEEHSAIQRETRRMQAYEHYAPIMKLLNFIDNRGEMEGPNVRNEYHRIRLEIMDAYNLVRNDSGYDVK